MRITQQQIIDLFNVNKNPESLVFIAYLVLNYGAVKCLFTNRKDYRKYKRLDQFLRKWQTSWVNNYKTTNGGKMKL